MIWGIEGDLGSGKTMLATILGFIHYTDNYNIISNYHLEKPFKFTPGSHINSLSDIPSDNNNVYLWDEMHEDADARKSTANIDMISKILQSRKRNLDIIGTDQNITDEYSQVDGRIRRHINIIMLPEILYDSNDMPEYVIGKYRLIKAHSYSKYRKFAFPCYINGYYIPDLYDTGQIVIGMDKGKWDIKEQLAEKYRDFGGTKPELASVIYFEENKILREKGFKEIPKNECNSIAAYALYLGTQ